MLDERTVAIGGRLRRLILEDIRRIGEAATALAKIRPRLAFPPDAAFGLADYKGPKLTREERVALEHLWEVVFVEVARGLTGTDPRAPSVAQRRHGWRGWLAPMDAPDDPMARASGQIDQATRGKMDPWPGVLWT